MIGGTDITIDRPFDAAARDALLAVLAAAWPEALLEGAVGDRPPVELRAVRGADLPAELFVYRDAASAESWRQDGATEANADAMIHVLGDAESFTCVVHHARGSETERVARALQRALDAVPPLEPVEAAARR